MKHKAFKYELSPSVEQSEILDRFFGCARYVYNWGLDLNTKAYQKDGTRISVFEMMKLMKEMKTKDETKWLGEVYSQTLQASLYNLGSSFSEFFNKRGKYPTFKKKNHRQSIQFPQKVKIQDNKVYLPKIGYIRFYKSRELEGRLKTTTVSKVPSGRYFVSFLCEIDEKLTQKKPVCKETAVGIDLGVKNFALTSDGEVFENQKYLRKSLRRLRIEQRKLCRCQKGSKRREKQRKVVARLHEHIANQRIDYLHKLTTSIVRKYDTICMEDLDIKEMLSHHNLALAIGEVGFAKCNRMLEYKCEWYGNNYIKIGRYEPSSKRCHVCGYINKGLTLHERKWQCPSCGSVIERDLNASLNIRDYGLGTQPSDAKTIHQNISRLKIENFS